MKPPSDYNDQPLCPRCGEDANGDRFEVCAWGNFSHADSCAHYQYGELCEECDLAVREPENPHDDAEKTGNPPE